MTTKIGMAMMEQRKTLILKALMIGASASVLAACQTTSPYVERRAGETPSSQPSSQSPQPRYDSQGDPLPPPSAAPSGTVYSQPLPPPEPTYTPPPPPPPPPPAPAYTPPPRPAAPVYRQVTTGKVVDAEGPTVSYTVKSGDALDAIAREMGVTRKVLADLNDLESPYKIKPGQKLKGPRSKAKAYVVGSGDTLSAIGRRFSVTAQALADANDMERSDPIRPNQKLILPSGFKDLGAQRVLVTPAQTPAPSYTSPAPAYQAPTPTPAPAPGPAPSTSTYPKPSQLPSAPVSAQPVTPAPRPAAPAIQPGAAPVGSIQTLGRGQFIWPLRGRVISNFGPRGTMQRSNGLNISANAGSTVRAAAAGRVIYAGSELSDFGNLVLVQHANGFVTAYAHLSRILVRNQDQVRQNQEIGEVGQTGGVTEPQLYFEMRFAPTARDKAEAFDPLLLLPSQ